MHRDSMTKVCLVTEELAGIGASGGIGGAFAELALLLARSGAHVDILYCPVVAIDADERKRMTADLRRKGIGLEVLDVGKYAFAPFGPEKRAYGVFKHLEESSGRYDIIHFHDYKGLGFYATAAKRQGLALTSSRLVVQLHGPTGWVLSANDSLPTHPDQLRIDHLERESIRHADEIVSPSQYLIDWMRADGYAFPEHGRVQVIRNICTDLASRLSAFATPASTDAGQRANGRIDEIVLFARHEDRKGFSVFCDAIDRLREDLADAGITVTFLGKFGSIAGRHSGLLLAERARRWRFPLRVRPGLDRDGAAEYLSANPNALVVIPSPEENSPYTVLEAIALGKRILTSDRGGARELIDPSQHPKSLSGIAAPQLAAAIANALEDGIEVAKPAESLDETERKWLAFHQRVLLSARRIDSSATDQGRARPRVVIGITHYERPEKLLDAVMSAMRQTYDNLQIVVVDDGSPGADTQRALDKIEILLNRCGGLLIRRENGYLGAARNSIAAATRSDYLCFLDDDDIAFPNMIEQLVAAATNTDASIVNCINRYMPESRRSEAWPNPDRFEHKVSYVPTGGPLSLAAIENCLGSATSLIRRDTFHALGGFTEIHGVGHEDYEFYVRALQHGATIEISPQVLYLYEVDRPSMIGTTSPIRNTKRVVDAIDFSRNTQAWRDLSELRAAQVAQERADNRFRWELGRHPHSSLISAIVETGADLPQQLDNLASYSREIGSPSAAAAFLDAKRSAQCDGLPMEPVADLLRAPTPTARQSVGDSDRLLEIKLDLAIGRHRQAIEQTMRLASGRRALSDQEWAVIREIAERIDDNSVLSELLGALARLRVAARQKRLAMPALFDLARRIDDRSTMEAVFHGSIRADETDYLGRHADVAKAVAAGNLPNGLTHYRTWGLKEGRKGFETSGEIASMADGAVASWDLDGIVFRNVARVNGGTAPAASAPRTAARA